MFNPLLFWNLIMSFLSSCFWPTPVLHYPISSVRRPGFVLMPPFYAVWLLTCSNWFLFLPSACSSDWSPPITVFFGFFFPPPPCQQVSFSSKCFGCLLVPGFCLLPLGFVCCSMLTDHLCVTPSFFKNALWFWVFTWSPVIYTIDLVLYFFLLVLLLF